MTNLIVKRGDSTLSSVPNHWMDLPRFLDWKDLSSILPLDLATSLSAWANDIEYQDASDYDNWAGNQFVQELSTHAADGLQTLGISREEKVLDFATGTGAIRLSLVKGGFTAAYGLDQSESCLRRQADLQRLMGFPLIEGQLVSDLGHEHDGSFSAIYMSSGLHHIPDFRGTLSSLLRLLKLGGKLIIADQTNMRRFNALSLVETTIDIHDMISRMQSGSREKTHSTMLLAEFHAGNGFSREMIEPLLKEHNMTIEKWDVYMWLSYFANNYARSYIGTDPAVLSAFAKHYENMVAADAFIKSVAPVFAAQNFFNFIMVAQKS